MARKPISQNFCITSVNFLCSASAIPLASARVHAAADRRARRVARLAPHVHCGAIRIRPRLAAMKRGYTRSSTLDRAPLKQARRDQPFLDFIVGFPAKPTRFRSHPEARGDIGFDAPFLPLQPAAGTPRRAADRPAGVKLQRCSAFRRSWSAVALDQRADVGSVECVWSKALEENPGSSRAAPAQPRGELSGQGSHSYVCRNEDHLRSSAFAAGEPLNAK